MRHYNQGVELRQDAGSAGRAGQVTTITRESPPTSIGKSGSKGTRLIRWRGWSQAARVTERNKDLLRLAGFIFSVSSVLTAAALFVTTYLMISPVEVKLQAMDKRVMALEDRVIPVTEDIAEIRATLTMMHVDIQSIKDRP